MMAEDGKTTIDDAAIRVSCTAGRCSTFVP
jgi:hypothetical protein